MICAVFLMAHAAEPAAMQQGKAPASRKRVLTRATHEIPSPYQLWPLCSSVFDMVSPLR